MDLQKVTPIIPKYPKQKLPKDHFQRMITIRFDRLQMQLNDLKLLITECLEQE